MSLYPCQPYSPRLDAVDAALNVGGTSFQPGFVNNVNGLQRFRVLADGGDGYATFNFDSTSILGGLPTLSVVATPEDFYVQQANSMILLDRTRTLVSQGSRSLEINASGYSVSDPANFRTAINGASLAGNNFSGLQTFTGLDSVGLRLKSLTSAQYGALTPGEGDLFLDSTTNRVDVRLNGVTQEVLTTQGGQTINGDFTASGTVTNQGIRLLQSAGGTLRGVLNCPSWDASFVALRNGTLAETAANTALYQSSNGDTGLNAASGRGVAIAIANAPVIGVTSGNVAVTGNLTASGTINVGGSGLATPSNTAIYSRQTGTSSGFWRGRIIAGGDNVAFLMGEYLSQAWLGGHNAALNAWAPLRVNPDGDQNLFLGNLLGGGAGVSPILTIANSGGVSTFSGRVVASDLILGGASGPLLRNNAGAFEVRNSGNMLLAGLTASVVIADAQCRTNLIQRHSGGSTLTLYNGDTSGAYHSVTIPGAGSLTNSSGVAGDLRLSSTVNQTGSAGSTNLLINRTETVLGSGQHNFADFQVASTSRFRIQNDAGLFWPDVRIQKTAKTFRTECFESTLSAWQETSRQEASATGPRWSVMGATPIVRQTHAAVATDLATAITRLNTLCTHLTNFGLFN